MERPRNGTKHGMSERSDTFHSILLCADRSSEAQVALRKASILARHLDAGIELFACDADHAWAVTRAPHDDAARAELAACLAAGRRYLAALRGSIAASDLRLTTRAACAATFADGVAERVREGRHDLVIKNLADGLATDLALVKACRVPLLLTRPRPWRPAPCIWVALDMASADAAAGRRAVAVARGLARACAGSFRLVYSRLPPGDIGPSRADERLATAALGMAAKELEILEGDPRVTLPTALQDGEADLLVIAQASGVASHPVRTRNERSVTETLLGIRSCDVLIVPPERGGSASRAMVDGASLREDASQRHGR